MIGWIKIHRSFLTWEWFDKPEMVQLFVYLLLKANHDAKEWHGMTIERGQVVTSVARIAQDTRLSTQVVRTCLNRLKSTNEITSESTSKYTIITISKYDTYQDCSDDDNEEDNKENNKQITNEQQTNNKQLTTNKNDKNKKNNKNDSIYTHTQFNNLVESLSRVSMCANTSEQVREIAELVGEITERVGVDSEAARSFSEYPILTKAYIWHWSHYPRLMKMFTESLSYPLFHKLSKAYELDDIKTVISQMANKLPARGDILESFETTFNTWASQNFQIQEKKRLGNARYN